MHVIGITGPIGHGKTSLVASLMKAEPLSKSGESSQVISEVADRLNASFSSLAGLPPLEDFAAVKSLIDPLLAASLRAVTPLPFKAADVMLFADDAEAHPAEYDKLWKYLEQAAANPNLLRAKITPANKNDYRAILQWIGGFVTTKLGRSLWYEELLRRAHLDGADSCKLYIFGGVRFLADAEVVRAAGGRIIDIERPNLAERDSNDPTERSRHELPIDIKVINDGSLAQLDSLAAILLRDIYAGQTCFEYQAKAL